jgi:hypothetical protein
MLQVRALPMSQLQEGSLGSAMSDFVEKPRPPFLLYLFFLGAGIGIDFPFLSIGGLPINDAIFLAWACLVLTSTKLELNWVLCGLASLFLISLISTFLMAARGLPVGSPEAFYCLRWLGYLALVAYLQNVPYGWDDVRKLLFSYVCGVCFLAIIAWIYWTFDPKYFWADTPYLSTEQFNPNTLGFYIATATPLLLYLLVSARSRLELIKLSLLASILLITAFFSYSKGTWLTIVASAIFFFGLTLRQSCRKILRLIPAFLTVAGLLYFILGPAISNAVFIRFKGSSGSNSQRLSMIETAFDVGNHFFFFGAGPKTYYYYALQFNSEAAARDPHNMFAWIYAELGFFAVIVVSSMLFFWLPMKTIFSHFGKYEKTLIFSFTFVLLLQSFVTGMPASASASWLIMGILAAPLPRCNEILGQNQ